jgi:hypothetical protein
MSAKERINVWKQVLGKSQLPEPGLGALELALESRQWCFERYYGPNGRILDKTRKTAISNKYVIWFEALLSASRSRAPSPLAFETPSSEPGSTSVSGVIRIPSWACSEACRMSAGGADVTPSSYGSSTR